MNLVLIFRHNELTMRRVEKIAFFV